MKPKTEHFELKYKYDDITYIKDFNTWKQLALYLRKLKMYDNDLQYTITKLNIK